ncbi:hypothetical protein [Thiothrix lacustris]|uniref:hypothetical protein n=1 Tax=Thiothrix lacustris TaxID=525917 RepID=UPI0027E3DB4D|nr:hypothetical protein [Thiothrix lacustris]WMP18137.1 hypothetical protein RCS87_03500 [Thiothrix lacustris]
MKKQKIHCVVVDQDVEMTASLDAALRRSDVFLELKQVASVQQLIPVLQELQPHLLFCPHDKSKPSVELLEMLQRYSPDTVLVWISRAEWQSLTTWLLGVESCTLPLNDADYFSQYIDFLLHYSAIKQDFRDCKHLLGVSELRCHWLVDYSWEAIAYISEGMHLYANSAYVSLFGFENMAEVRSMPVASLAEQTERKIFEAMSKVADASSKPSNRLLLTLRTLDGERMRAEIRFIPAVLKSRRCVQLHVRPLERNILKGVSLRKQDNPWETMEQHLQDTPPTLPVSPPVAPSTSVPTQSTPPKMTKTVMPSPINGMEMRFHKFQRLDEMMPNLYMAAPEFRQKDQLLDYSTLLKQLVTPTSRFRLDYWNLGQVVLKLSSQKSEKPDYLVFVSVGGAILNNEGNLKRIIELLNAFPNTTRRIVLALQYRDCMEQMVHLGHVIKLFKAVKVRLAIDGVPDEPSVLRFMQVVKPVLVRLNAVKPERLPVWIAQLTESQCKIIISGIQDNAALNAAYSSGAAYVHDGAIT